MKRRIIRHDIHHAPLVFDSTNIFHKNSNHTGTRYSIVLFNQDYRWASDRSPRAQRSHPFPMTKHELAESGDVYKLPIPPEIRKELWCTEPYLLELLNATKFRPDRCGSGATPHHKYVDSDNSCYISFGLTLSRKSRKYQLARGIGDRHSVNRNNVKHSELFHALSLYLNTLHPDLFGLSDQYGFTSFIVAKDAMCKYHLDTNNRGVSCIVGIGDYWGGEVMLNIGMSNLRMESIAEDERAVVASSKPASPKPVQSCSASQPVAISTNVHQ